MFTTLSNSDVFLILPNKQIREIFSNKVSTNCLHRQLPPQFVYYVVCIIFIPCLSVTLVKSEHHFSIVTQFCDGSCETFKTYRYFHKYPVSAQTLIPQAHKSKGMDFCVFFSRKISKLLLKFGHFFFLFQNQTKFNYSTGISFIIPQGKK